MRFLEVGVDPDLRERADGHQALPGLHIVAGVDVAAGHQAVDVADDVAVAEVQLGLIQIVLGLSSLASACLTAGASGISRSKMRSRLLSGSCL